MRFRGDPAGPHRFPYVAALLCAACVIMAGYTWMRYSYCWDITVERLHGQIARISEDKWPYRAYVRFEGRFLMRMSPRRIAGTLIATGVRDPALTVTFFPRYYFPVGLQHGEHGHFTGRVIQAVYFSRGEHIDDSYSPVVDATASRFTGASIAGLVVGAMGIFVFTVALRHWLMERRKFREAARA